MGCSSVKQKRCTISRHFNKLHAFDREALKLYSLKQMIYNIHTSTTLKIDDVSNSSE
jgi:hypothetical protein